MNSEEERWIFLTSNKILILGESNYVGKALSWLTIGFLIHITSSFVSSVHVNTLLENLQFNLLSILG